MADDSSLDKILDRLPYSDGTGRRRFVSGGILLTGTIIIFFGKFKGIFDADFEVTDFLGSPIILLAAVLILYALGNLTEMLAGLFLVRMASGVMWAVGFPHRASRRVSNRYMRWLAYGCLIAWTPFYMIWEMIRGLRGDTRYRLPLESDLTPEAFQLLEATPPKVRSGLYHPVSNDGEFAMKHMVDRFPTETDRRWARRLLGQAEDVSSVTTAFILIALLSFGKVAISPYATAYNPFAEDAEFVAARSQFRDLDRRLFDYGLIASLYKELPETTSSLHLDAAVDAYKSCGSEFDYMTSRPHFYSYTYAEGDYHELSYLCQKASGPVFFALDFYPNQPIIDSLLINKLERWLDDMNTMVDTARDLTERAKPKIAKFAVDERQEDSAGALIGWALPVFFLFLYVGYFKTIHNTVVNIVEASLPHTVPSDGSGDASL